MQPQWVPYAFGLSAVLLWSTVATAFKLALAQMTPIQLVLLAALVSIVFLGSVVIWQGKWRLCGRQFQAQPKFYIITGLLNPLAYYWVLFQAYDLLPAQQAQPLNYTWPVVLSLLAVPVLGQKLRSVDVIAAALAYFGVLVIATSGNLLALEFESPLGVALALASTLLWASYWLLNTKDKGDPVVSLLLSFVTSLPFIAALTLFTDGWPELTLKSFAGAAYVGLFEMGLTFVLWLMALKKAQQSDSVSTASISNLAFISPVLSLFFIAAILKESLQISTFVGLAMIITALGFQKLKRS
ncbi:DMT family transporter [Paraferrimonas sedimenticola]|uniref:Membrane protein n=1 Tax=Paraferrimonas sedimenticola TaxID=375674 RepID=A0AA37W1Q3_9GAMM|nr:DMT family transporter [Paraferrimonas sedimenticola]GLP97093.1 membrane protein [Paraferrimonas sedimenticola]